MDAEKINIIIQQKTADLKDRLKGSINSFGMQHVSSTDNPSPLTNINTRLSQQFGMYNRIRIKFKRSGVFVHKGVGRGTKASQVGSTNRQPKEWFNPVVEKFTDELSDAVADEMVNVVFNSIKIK